MKEHLMLPNRCKLYVLATLIAALASAAGAAEKVDVRFAPVKGQVQKIKTTIDQKVTNTINGKAQSLAETIGLEYGFETLDVTPDGTATVKVTFDNVVFKHSDAVSSVEYESSKQSEQIPQMAKGFAALAGNTFTMKVTPAGKVGEVTGLDVMVDGILKKLDLSDGPQKAALEKKVRRDFGEDAVRDNMQIFFAVYPDQPVTVGQSWKRKVSMNKGLPVSAENTYTLKAVNGDELVIDVTGKLSNNADAPPMDMGGSKISYALSGELSGTMKLSKQTGWIRGAEMSQKWTGEMTMDAGSGRINKVPISTETKITLEGK